MWIRPGRATHPVAAARVCERAGHHLRAMECVARPTSTRYIHSGNHCHLILKWGPKCGFVWYSVRIRLELDVGTSGTTCGFVWYCMWIRQGLTNLSLMHQVRCGCVYERVKERECVCVCQRQSVCGRERECVCLCVWPNTRHRRSLSCLGRPPVRFRAKVWG